MVVMGTQSRPRVYKTPLGPRSPQFENISQTRTEIGRHRIQRGTPQAGDRCRCRLPYRAVDHEKRKTPINSVKKHPTQYGTIPTLQNFKSACILLVRLNLRIYVQHRSTGNMGTSVK